ncbi:MAG TPA: hypothetical protein VGG30_03730 [Pirellulales bacterium]|jgi:hypothetical protein
MRIRPSAFAFVLAACLGCQLLDQGVPHGAPADVCNTPGRKAFADQIVARGGLLVTEESHWDNSVEADIKQKMGPPLSNVVLPQDKFTAQDVAHAKASFPEAEINYPSTLDEFYETHGHQPPAAD